MDLIDRDGRVLWHPYTQHRTAPPPLPVVSAKGAYLYTVGGRRILDGVSSWWTCIHGHGHPRLVAALARQAGTLDHVLFAGVTHPKAVELAERLTALTGLDRVFFSDNGSTAVEAGLKMAVQYWANRGETRTRFLALPGAFHGDTVGAMSVSDVALFKERFSDLLFPVDRYEEDTPLNDDVAAVIVEPILQGAGGMRVHPPEALAALAARCRDAGTLLIADEVLTGFGRTGRMFACEHAAVRPDVMCLAKGLTGGLLPLAATLCTEEIFDAYLSRDRSRAFLHGHTFTANPIAAAVSLESLRLFEEECTLARARRIGEQLEKGLRPLEERAARGEGVRDVRGIGPVRAVELDAPEDYLAEIGPALAEAALARDVLLRPLGNVLYALPPLCLTERETARLAAVMVEVVEECLDR